MTKKGLKVTNLSRDKKIGVAAESLNELLQKSCEKLMVKDKWQTCKCYVAEDGTLVDDDDYFRTLPAQSLLVVVRRDEKMKTDFEYLYDVIRSTKHEYLSAGQSAQHFLSQDVQGKLQRLQEYVGSVEEPLTVASQRDHDPQWFEGIDTNDKTKEEFMSRKAKDRIKGYFYKTKNLLTKSDSYINSKNGDIKSEIDIFIKQLQRMLEANHYNNQYFNRGAKESERLCDRVGRFQCGGLWSQERCAYSDHRINPYRTREERILFQTWNLDHRIELSRSIIPSVLTAACAVPRSAPCYSCGARAGAVRLSANWYYRELFTADNLKLVHIVCHDKARHDDARSDSYLVCSRCWSMELP